MDNPLRLRLRKCQRLCSRKAQEELFAPGHGNLRAHPLHAIFRRTDDAQVRILVSVPKRHFKHATDRNRIKRQLREAYRQQQHLLTAGGLHIAFLWADSQHLPTAEIFARMKRILQQINDKRADV